MKRLFVLAFATLVAMCLVSCKQNEVKLHELVGTVYGEAHGEMGGDGIYFDVDDDGWAWICSMNDVKRDRQTSSRLDHMWDPDFTWSVFGSDTVKELDTVLCKITRSFRYFIDKEEFDSTMSSGRTEHFLKYNFEERDEEGVTIYPMLRYKAKKYNNELVCPPYTEPKEYNGFIGELIPADSVIRRIDTASVVLFDTVEKVIDAVIEIPFKDKVKFDTIWRNDTVNKRDSITNIDTIYHVMPARYADTLWNNIKKGDRNYPDQNHWEKELDTNWSYSDIKGLGNDGKENTRLIVTSDVPCRQKVTPDSSSAARACYQYYTRNYYDSRRKDSNDVFYKDGQGEWFLPSREELKRLFDARERINSMNYRSDNDKTPGFEPLQNCYWSSNQKDAKNAWYKCFSDNGVEDYIPKANNNYRVSVRAIRKVKLP